MKENKLLQLSQEFVVDIIKLVRVLGSKGEHGFADQIKRSGTRIGANITKRAKRIEKATEYYEKSNRLFFKSRIYYSDNSEDIEGDDSMPL